MLHSWFWTYTISSNHFAAGVIYAKSVKEILFMVATDQEMVRGQNCTMSGKRQGISLRVGENLSLWKKSGKSVILRLRISSNIYNTFVHFTDVNHVVLVEVLFIKIWRQADVGFSRKSILYARYAEKLSIHVHCMWLAVRINKWVERMLLGSRGLSPLSGLICEIVNSAGQGNFTFVKKK